MLTDFATYDDIRAILGVSTDELEDSVLAAPLWERQLILDLEDVNSAIPDAFQTVAAIPYASRSTVQKRFYDVTQLCSAYAVAAQLLTSIAYFAEVKIQDGRAAKERVADPFSSTRDGVMGGLVSIRIRLSVAYNALNTSAELKLRMTRVTAAGVGLPLDPVTNA